MKKNEKALVSVLLIIVMFAVCVGCGSGKSESKPAPDTKTDAVKAEEVTTEAPAPEIATTETEPQTSDETTKMINSLWDNGGEIRYNNITEGKYVIIYTESEYEFDESDIEYITVTPDKAENDYLKDFILFVYECDKAASNLKEDDSIKEIPDYKSIKTNFVDHNWNEYERAEIVESNYLYYIYKPEGHYQITKYDYNTQEEVYDIIIDDKLIGPVNNFIEYSKEMKDK